MSVNGTDPADGDRSYEWHLEQAARDSAKADEVTEATIADLSIAASMHGPHEDMHIPRVRVVELLDEIKRLRELVVEHRMELHQDGQIMREQGSELRGREEEAYMSWLAEKDYL